LILLKKFKGIASMSRMLKTDVSKRLYGLDILRSVAILQVMLGHTMQYIPEGAKGYISPFLIDGVGIFFVLSGFLIGSILIKIMNTEDFNTRSLLRFWINRWMRTLPMYYVMLVVVYIVSLIPSSAYDSSFWGLKTKLSYLFFFQNFNWDTTGFFGESWSLCVEEWFYLLIPLFMFILYRIYKPNQRKAIFIPIVTVIIGVALFRLCKFISLSDFAEAQGVYSQIFKYQVLSRLDCIVYGVLGAYISYYYKEKWSGYKNKLFLSELLLLVAYVLLGRFMNTIEYVNFYNLIYNVIYFPMFSISILLMLPFLNLMKSYSGIINKSLTYISLISYSLYLLHQNVKYMIVESLGDYWGINDNMLRFASVWVLTIVLSTLTYLAIEKPFMNMRKKIKI